MTTPRLLLARVFFSLLLLFASAPLLAQSPTDATPLPMATATQTLIENYQRILSLQIYSSKATKDQQQAAARAGEYLFLQNHQLAGTILERLLAPQHTSAEMDTFLTTVGDPIWVDADLFAVRSILMQIAKKAQFNSQQHQQLHLLLANLARAHNRYGQELNTVLKQSTLSQNKPLRPAWAAYEAKITLAYPPQALLEQFTSTLPEPIAVTPPEQPGDIIALTRKNEWQGMQLEPGTVLLTFDDGPHPVFTSEILAILARYQAKAIFFQLGQNLGSVENGHAELTRNQELEHAILSAGHAIGNHSFTHPFLPKLDQAQVQQEIDKTQALLDLIIPADDQRTHMFRAPYGARNSMILGEIGERGLRSVLWNVDSLDWSDPIPESIVHRILQELEHAGRGIILMHDIHPKTVLALPMLMDELIKRGYHFVNWDGQKLIPTEPAVSMPAPT